MCQHCATLKRHVSAIARGDHYALDCVRVALREIRAESNYTVITRASRVQRTIADAQRRIVAALWRYMGTHSQANYSEIERSLAAYFAAFQRANSKTKTRLINPAGKPEPIGSPTHFTVAPDCFINDRKKNDPGAIVANVDHAQRAIRNSVKSANHFLRACKKEENSGNLGAAAVAHSFACDYVEHANNVEETLAEYVSINR